MVLKVTATPVFSKAVKKLHAKDKESVDDAVRAIAANPTIGEMKKGDLLGIRVYNKFRINKQEVLLSYSVGSDQLLLVAVGSHESFYRDMKR